MWQHSDHRGDQTHTARQISCSQTHLHRIVFQANIVYIQMYIYSIHTGRDVRMYAYAPCVSVCIHCIHVCTVAGMIYRLCTMQTVAHEYLYSLVELATPFSVVQCISECVSLFTPQFFSIILDRHIYLLIHTVCCMDFEFKAPHYHPVSIPAVRI